MSKKEAQKMPTLNRTTRSILRVFAAGFVFFTMLGGCIGQNQDTAAQSNIPVQQSVQKYNDTQVFNVYLDQEDAISISSRIGVNQGEYQYFELRDWMELNSDASSHPAVIVRPKSADGVTPGQYVIVVTGKSADGMIEEIIRVEINVLSTGGG